MIGGFVFPGPLSKEPCRVPFTLDIMGVLHRWRGEQEGLGIQLPGCRLRRLRFGAGASEEHANVAVPDPAAQGPDARQQLDPGCSLPTSSPVTPCAGFITSSTSPRPSWFHGGPSTFRTCVVPRASGLLPLTWAFSRTKLQPRQAVVFLVSGLVDENSARRVPGWINMNQHESFVWLFGRFMLFQVRPWQRRLCNVRIKLVSVGKYT